MHFLVLMAMASATIAFLAWRLWRVGNTPALALGSFFMYYWSIHGGWTIVVDELFSSDAHAVHFYRHLTWVQLDTDYFVTLLTYSMFVIVVQITVLVRIVRRQEQASSPAETPIELSFWRMASLIVLGLVLSFAIVESKVVDAIALGRSIYSETRGDARDLVDLFTLHQIMNRIVLVTCASGLAVQLHPSGRVASRSNAASRAVFDALVLVVVVYEAMLGNKHDLLFMGAAVALLHLAWAPKVNWLALGAGPVFLVCILVFIDASRGTSVFAVDQHLDNLNWDAFARLFYHTEAFSAHISLYAAIHLAMSLTGGSSVISLLASPVPRLLWQDRPPDIYYYYAQGLGIPPVGGQGFTIHHATGWYLNFGFPGVAVGALLLGFAWAKLLNMQEAYSAARSRALRACCAVGFSTFTASLPTLLRAGLEGYKASLVEHILIPVGVLLVCEIPSRQSRTGAASRQVAPPVEGADGEPPSPALQGEVESRHQEDSR